MESSVFTMRRSRRFLGLHQMTRILSISRITWPSLSLMRNGACPAPQGSEHDKVAKPPSDCQRTRTDLQIFAWNVRISNRVDCDVNRAAIWHTLSAFWKCNELFIVPTFATIHGTC